MWDVITIICFSTLAAIVFESIKEIYHWTSPEYIKKKKLLKKIERLLAEEGERMNDLHTYPSNRTAALNRVNCLVYIREIIESL